MTLNAGNLFIDGKEYVEASNEGSEGNVCQGCVAENCMKLCLELPYSCLGYTIIFKRKGHENE
jgi:hypothetical protein